jgi:hypothetical protein
VKGVLTTKVQLLRFWLCRELGLNQPMTIKNESGKTHLDKANTFLRRNTKDFLVIIVQVETS